MPTSTSEGPDDDGASNASATKSAASISVNPYDLFVAASAKGQFFRAMLTTAMKYPVVDKSRGELVIDVGSLLRAALIVGSRENANSPSSAAWLWQDLIDLLDEIDGRSTLHRGIGLDSIRRIENSLRSETSEISSHLRSGMSYVLSYSVRNTVIPRAIELAERTVSRSEYSQRHLIAALLERPPEKWRKLDFAPSEDDLTFLRDRFRKRVAANHDPGENLSVWAREFGNPSAEDKNASSDKHNDFLATQRDQPALDDALGRKPFATVLAKRLIEAQKSQCVAKAIGEDRAFMVNLDGPWGSGKSTIVNFIKSELKGEDPAWAVVDFNAWRSQRIEPAWWGVICQIARQLPSQLSPWQRFQFQRHWFFWKLRNDFAPVALAMLLFGVAILFGLGVPWLAQVLPAGSPPAALLTYLSTSLGQFIEPTQAIALLTTFAGAASLGRHLFFGSSQTGKAVASLSSDPYRHVMKLFSKLVAAANRPILIVIDDIDRCSEDYVVNLLEDIQTMLREAPVSYLVVGDRSWITSSFAYRYDKFRSELECPGKPLGHQFLEKVFQFSATVPTLSDKAAKRFWQGIVNSRSEPDGALEKQNEKEANRIVSAATTDKELQEAISQTENPRLRRSVAAKAAIKVASPEFAKRLESRYAKYGPLLDRNPRAIKRLVNKIGMNQAVMMLNEVPIAHGPLARWTIIELRWPRIAELLTVDPQLIEDPDPESDELASMLEQKDFRDVVGHGRSDCLSAGELEAMVRV